MDSFETIPLRHDSIVVLTHDGSRTLRRPDGVTDHSMSGAVTEARYVYRDGCQLFARAENQGQPFRVLEIGFGAGLNFLVAADQALQLETSLEYVAFERERISSAQFRELAWWGGLQHPALADALESLWRELEANPARVCRQLHRDRVTLDLHFEDVATAELGMGAFDAVFLDPYDPTVNEGLWEQPFLRRLAAALRPGGRLASYCVRSEIRRRLKEQGFAVQAIAGPPGGKRQVLIGTKS